MRLQGVMTHRLRNVARGLFLIRLLSDHHEATLTISILQLVSYAIQNILVFKTLTFENLGENHRCKALAAMA